MMLQMKQKRLNIKIRTLIIIFGVVFVFAMSTKSFAACGSCSIEIGSGTSVTQVNTTVSHVQNLFNDVDSHVDNEIDETQDHVEDEFEDLRDWIINTLWGENILPSMVSMAEQFTSVAMQQTFIIGTFFDAKHQMETQRLTQELQAVAHKDYQPSVSMCKLGSSIKSLSASERKGEYNSVLMSQRSLDRQLGNANSSATYGNDLDKASRLTQYVEKFCDPRDNNDSLDILCTHRDGVGGSDNARLNKDIDFTRTIDSPWTLEVDFTDQTVTEHEEEVLALSNNLYSHFVFYRPGPALLRGGRDGKATSLQKRYMDMRANIAKRNVAQNSFNAITTMKSEGSGGTKSFLESILRELGVSGGSNNGGGGNNNANELTELLGDNPSYYAQMEVLTKKIYQNPDFYTNLYDKPANVARKGVALQAIGLMQKFDMFKSYLRSEASLSILLELAVIDLQDEIENEINAL